MLWKLKKQRQQEEIIQEDMKKEEKKNKKKNLKTIPSGAGAGATTSSSSSSSSSSSTSSSFSISRFLPFSWISSKLMPKAKRSTTSRTAPDPNQKPKSIAFSAPVPPAPPRRSPGFPSSHESFRRTVAADLDGDSSRFPPPVISGVGTDAPHRRSLGDDDAKRPPTLDQCWRADRRRHHHSVGDLQLPELRHLLQLSDPLGAAESNGGSDASSDYELQSPPRKQQPRGRRRSNAARPSEGDRTDAGPRKSFSGKTRRQRARPKVKISSPRPSASATARRKRGPAVEAEKEKMRELERFAVVKRSQDPQRDFRESMVEMIWERGIGRPEELESLLACYLSLNADEHHDVIVKVFRQVWFELNPELFSQYCY